DRSRPSHRNNLRVFVWIELTLEDLATSVAHRIADAVRHGDEVGLRLHVSEPLPIDRAGVAGAVTNFPPRRPISHHAANVRLSPAIGFGVRWRRRSTLRFGFQPREHYAYAIQGISTEGRRRAARGGRSHRAGEPQRHGLRLIG